MEQDVLRGFHMGKRRRNQLQTVIILLSIVPSTVSPFHPFFRVYLNSLITHLMINQKGHLKTQNYLTLKWIEVTAASVSQSMPKSAPTQDLLALQRKVKLTEYYWYFLTLFWVACRCFWYMGLPALFLLNVLMRSGGRAGEERRGEADTCSASKEGWVLGVQEKDGEGKAPWSCCFSVCIL